MRSFPPCFCVGLSTRVRAYGLHSIDAKLFVWSLGYSDDAVVSTAVPSSWDSSVHGGHDGVDIFGYDDVFTRSAHTRTRRLDHATGQG